MCLLKSCLASPVLSQAPAYAGIPVTQRADDNFPQGATSFAVVTGHTKDDDAPPPTLPVADTLVFLMGVRALPKIVAQLLARGDSSSTPVALVRWGTTRNQQVVTGTLDTIEAEVERSGLKPPALIVVGNVVNLRQQLQWFDNRPLWGQTVVVTRAREQASGLVEELRNLGANVVQCPTIRVETLDEYSIVDAALQNLSNFDWVVFTSTNGVEQGWKRVRAAGQRRAGVWQCPNRLRLARPQCKRWKLVACPPTLCRKARFQNMSRKVC
jgi:uroporphyrinogen III methyltransferase/synthase